MDVKTRINLLQIGERPGHQIAEILLQEGVGIEDAQKGFEKAGYVVGIEDLVGNTKGLHVSDKPLDGITAAFASMQVKALPMVVWKL